MYLRRAGWTDEDEFAIHTAAGPIRPTITGPTRAASTWVAPRSPRRTTRRERADGRGTVSAGGTRVRVPARLDRQPAVRDRAGRCSMSWSALDLGLIGPAIEASELFPRRTNVSWYVALVGNTGSARASSSAASARRCPRARERQARRSRTCCSKSAAREPVTVLLDGGELEVDIDDDLSVSLTGWARARLPGSVSKESRKGAHEAE